MQYHRPGEPPVVEISGSRSGAEWRFAVKDNGQGVPHNQQDSIFEPLKRLHGSDTPGTGLGLALCRTIVARHGGHMWVESDGDGCGIQQAGLEQLRSSSIGCRARYSAVIRILTIRILKRCEMPSLRGDRIAFRGPGNPPLWAPGDKNGVGTA
jgi:signal transduction histidine kinase